MKREGIKYPKFAEKFFRIDFDASPLPVLCLYPAPVPVALDELRLEVRGLEEHPRKVAWSTLKSLPRVRITVPLICQIFNWAEEVEWEGIRVADLLDFLRIETHPHGYFGFYSRDGQFFEALSRDEARDPRVLLAYGLNGTPLPEQHGGPLRLVVPFLQGYKSVKWVGSIQAFRNDPQGVKRLLGQSASGQLNDEWRARYQIVLPAGKAGDPPPFSAAPVSSGNETMASEVKSSSAMAPIQGTHGISLSTESGGRFAEARPTDQAALCEILAIVRPGKRLATRQALESVGVVSYTTYGVMGRSRQRGLKFSSGSAASDSAVNPPAIKFLPKQLFSIIVESWQVEAAVNAIIKANKSGKGQYGDGKIFVLEVDQAVRVSTDQRGGEAV